MAAGKSSRINRQYKTKYRIRNWREYERGLRSRGDVTIWLSEDAIAAWIPPKNGLRGGQRRYSNLAIRTALTLRVVFGHPLRQTEGFLDSLLSLMSRDLKAPDHTTLSRRNQMVVVPPLTRAHGGPIDLIVDSTGLKILGRGQWNAHKTSKKRRDRGTDQIAVKIQHKDRLLTDPGAIEDILAVEDDVVPFDRADVLEQGGVDAFFCDSPREHRLRDHAWQAGEDRLQAADHGLEQADAAP